MKEELYNYITPIASVTVNVAPLREVAAGRIVTLSGPSGAGKTSLAAALDGHGQYASVGKMTTRRPRLLSTMDIYTDQKAIDAKRAEGDFLYEMAFGEAQYLQPVAPLIRFLGANLIVLVDMPSVAALGLKQTLPDRVTTVFVDVPEPETTLPNRMRERGDTEAVIKKRVRDDMEFVYPLRNRFDSVYLNPDVASGGVSQALRNRDIVFESK